MAGRDQHLAFVIGGFPLLLGPVKRDLTVFVQNLIVISVLLKKAITKQTKFTWSLIVPKKKGTYANSKHRFPLREVLLLKFWKIP